MRKVGLCLLGLAAACLPTQAQELSQGRLSGNAQVDAQYYVQDTVIGAEDVPQDGLMNAFMNLNYALGDFNAGVRYEAYLDPLLGFDPRFQGQGISYRFAEYSGDVVGVTVGNFYEQFGSGLVFRSYEERQLGIDNAMDGLRVRVNALDGLQFTGIIGKQRSYWNLGAGLVRGLNAEADLNALIPGMEESDVAIQLGASAVNRFQASNHPKYSLPDNVGAGSVRANISYGGFNIFAEFAFKSQDPSASDQYFWGGLDSTGSPVAAEFNPSGYSFNRGNAQLVTATYSERGLGVSLSMKRLDRMDFRSDRNATVNDLTMSFLPPLTKQHTYRLATLYPYATQPNGEFGLQGEVTYTIPRGSSLGGKYGTTVNVNFAQVTALDTSHVDAYTYESQFMGNSDDLFFRDFNVEISRKLNSDVKAMLSFFHLDYNKDVVEGKSGYGIITADIVVADVLFNLSDDVSLRVEAQHVWESQEETATESNYGNWMYGLAELTLGSNWFVTVFDEYNYGNENEKKQLHYYTIQTTFVEGAQRVALSWSRQREGLVCVGGVCRNVPASSGLALSVSTSF